MSDRRVADVNSRIKPLLNLLEQRFDIRLPKTESIDHWRSVHRHYREKREFLLVEHGEAGALECGDYAKAFLISEATRLMILREIEPRPKKKAK